MCTTFLFGFAMLLAAMIVPSVAFPTRFVNAYPPSASSSITVEINMPTGIVDCTAKYLEDCLIGDLVILGGTFITVLESSGAVLFNKSSSQTQTGGLTFCAGPVVSATNVTTMILGGIADAPTAFDGNTEVTFANEMLDAIETVANENGIFYTMKLPSQSYTTQLLTPLPPGNNTLVVTIASGTVTFTVYIPAGSAVFCVFIGQGSTRYVTSIITSQRGTHSPSTTKPGKHHHHLWVPITIAGGAVAAVVVVGSILYCVCRKRIEYQPI